MRSDVAAAPVITQIYVFVPPEPPRRRWRRLWPGTGFLDRPGGAEYANRWHSACGQGG
jgi:hypothetical protein